MGKIQKQDIKTVAELTNAGATAADLPNDDQIFVSALNINKTLKDAITDGNIGGDGGLGVNYFSDARANTIANFVLYNDGGATPTDGVGGTVTGVTKTLNTTTPIMGASSYRLSKDAANRQGQGGSLTTDKTLDAPVIAGEPITVQFRYRTSANYATGDVRMFVYFVGPNTLQALNGISNAGEFGNSLVKSFDDRSQFTANTSCPAGTTAIRVIGHIATTSTSAYDIDIDEITIGTASTLTAPIVTDWVPYTPPVAVGSGSITNFVASGFWKRDGDDIIVKGSIRFTGNSGTWSGGLFVGLPSPFTVDYSKLKNATSSGKIQRTGTFECSTPNLTPGRGTLVFADSLPVNPNTHFAFNIFFVKTDDAGVAEDFVRHTAAANLSNTVIGTTVNDNYITWDDVRIPVTQFTQGSNVISSTQANFLSGAFRASRNGTDQTGVNPNDSFVKININSVSASTDYVRGGFSYNTANSRFVAHKKLKLNVSARIQVNSTNTVANAVYMAAIRKNGSVNIISGQFYRSAISPATAGVSCSGSIELDAGDFIELMLYSNADHSVNQLTVSGPATSTYFEATEIPDLSVVGISGAPLQVLSTESNTVAPAAQNIWMANHTGNSLTLSPGVWRLRATSLLSEVSPPGFGGISGIGVFGANGTGTSAEPAALQSLPGVQLLTNEGVNGRVTTIGAIAFIRFSSPDILVQASQTFTAYAVAYAAQVMTTPANARVFVTLRAERIR